MTQFYKNEKICQRKIIPVENCFYKNLCLLKMLLHLLVCSTIILSAGDFEECATLTSIFSIFPTAYCGSLKGPSIILPQ